MVLSIIIPVYKAEDYLKECLNSCLNQDISKDKYEIICVDDGSPDKCGLILDEYAKVNDNLIVLHKENSGVSAARNDAIDISKGDYIWFVDSDDFIEKESLSILTSIMEINNPGKLLVGLYKTKYEKLTSEEEMLRKTQTLKADSHYLCGQIFDGRLIRENGIRFHLDVAIEEDTLFWYEYSIYQKRETYDYKPIVYFYRNNPTSALHKAEYTMLPSYINTAAIMRAYKVQEVGDTLYADFKSTLQVYKALNVMVRLSICERRKWLRELKRKGAFGFRPSKEAVQKLLSKGIKANTRHFAIAPTMRGYYVMLCEYRIRRLKQMLYSVLKKDYDLRK